MFYFVAEGDTARMERCPHGEVGYRRSYVGSGVGLRFGFAGGVDF